MVLLQIPSRVTANKGFGPQIWGTVYISEVNGARNVNSDAQVSMNKNSDLLQKFFLRDGWEDSAPTHFLKTGIVRI